MSQRLAIRYEHQIPLARQAVFGLAAEIGFRRILAHYVATAVSEMASNLVFHAAEGGFITLRALREDDRLGIEILAEDHGPGIADLKRAMQDGYSTRGSLGGGLPGIRRLMDVFEIDSEPGRGTRILARKWQPCSMR